MQKQGLVQQTRYRTDDDGSEHLEFECPECKIWCKIKAEPLIEIYTMICIKCGFTEHSSMINYYERDKH